ncbi:copper uptake system-associated protein [Aquipseudomonas campi]|uniref:Copper uptake system-associated protein n=1 Tax=Aquipseudomonas campi TaxID=2731681 RepID=A0A6M8FCY0_9GAMM|nr:copper uptake system-associated protein [Pseudomonas campi]QKE61909.1 copper uptake system-associated protein [Pseudomonas campi]
MKWMTPWVLLCAVLCNAAWAADGDDRQAIEHLMKHTWERPDAVLDVGPVTVEGEHAVAGWTQDARGGRALLRRDGETWKVLLCAGDGLLDVATLRDAGLSAAQAASLNQAVRAAEATQPAARVKQFALFKGTVRVDPHQMHEPVAH